MAVVHHAIMTFPNLKVQHYASLILLFILLFFLLLVYNFWHAWLFPYPNSLPVYAKPFTNVHYDDTLTVMQNGRYKTKDTPHQIALWYQEQGWLIEEGPGGILATRKTQLFKGIHLTANIIVRDRGQPAYYVESYTILWADIPLPATFSAN